MKFRLSNLILIASLAITLLPGCAGGSVRARLNEAEAMLDERPADALSILEGIDSTSLRFKPRRVRHALLRAIALDKNHKSDSGFIASVGEAARWYARFGNRHDRLRSCYYYGDLLRDVGMLEEAAVQLMLAEKEAVRQKDWFFAGMSARGLYYIFAKTYNFPEELSSIKRAVKHFHLAGKEPHEDDARMKLAIACYDNSDFEKADSLYDVCIKMAEQKKDSVRWRLALANSVDVMLYQEPYKPDSAITRLARAESLGYKPNSRALANYSLSEALVNNIDESKLCLKAAYSSAKNESERTFIKTREYQICLVKRDTASAFPLLRDIYTYVDSLTVKTLEHSVVKAQGAYLDSENRSLIKERRVSRMIALLITLTLVLLLFVGFMLYKRWLERRRMAEEKKALETDRYRLACDELGSLGLKSFDKISEAYYSPAIQQEASMLAAYKSVVRQFKSEDFQNRFLDNVDRKYEGVVTKLREQIPSLSRNRIMLFAYLVNGLSYTTIMVLLGRRSKQNVYDMRCQLIYAIKAANPADKELFLSYLPNRSTKGG